MKEVLFPLFLSSAVGCASKSEIFFITIRTFAQIAPMVFEKENVEFTFGNGLGFKFWSSTDWTGEYVMTSGASSETDFITFADYTDILLEDDIPNMY